SIDGCGNPYYIIIFLSDRFYNTGTVNTAFQHKWRHVICGEKFCESLIRPPLISLKMNVPYKKRICFQKDNTEKNPDKQKFPSSVPLHEKRESISAGDHRARLCLPGKRADLSESGNAHIHFIGIP